MQKIKIIIAVKKRNKFYKNHPNFAGAKFLLCLIGPLYSIGRLKQDKKFIMVSLAKLTKKGEVKYEPNYII